MQQVSNRLKQLSESATLAMARMSRELKAQGHNVIALSLGEPDLTPQNLSKSLPKMLLTTTTLTTLLFLVY